jgi:hypothetical protein
MLTEDDKGIRLPLTAQNNYLPGIFRERTNSYKFFWLLALLDASKYIEDFDIPIREVTVRMVQRAWYPILYFRLHFGKADELENTVGLVKAASGLEDDAKAEEIYKAILNLPPKSEAAKAIDDLARYVPFRILTPWFRQQLTGLKDNEKNKKIEELAALSIKSRTESAPYFFKDAKTIRFSWDWRGYFRDHYSILVDFCYWRLADFLQVRNPNVPNIASKLLPVLEQREQGRLRKPFLHFLQQYPNTKCIYSNQSLNAFDIDHFIPWSFLSHDLPWNLVPVNPKANNQKRDQLPHQALIQPLGEFQHAFLKFLVENTGADLGFAKNEILNAYEFLFMADPIEISGWSLPEFGQGFSERIHPLLLQAKHQGFPGPWTFQL